MTLKELITIDQLEQFLAGLQICVYEVHSGADQTKRTSIEQAKRTSINLMCKPALTLAPRHRVICPVNPLWLTICLAISPAKSSAKTVPLAVPTRWKPTPITYLGKFSPAARALPTGIHLTMGQTSPLGGKPASTKTVRSWQHSRRGHRLTKTQIFLTSMRQQPPLALAQPREVMWLPLAQPWVLSLMRCMAMPASGI